LAAKNLPPLVTFGKIKQLKVGDKILTKDGGYKVVKSISKYSEERIAEIYLEKNLSYVTKECLALIPNKYLLRLFPNDFIKYGIDEVKKGTKLKLLLLMFAYWFRLLFY
jgi:hypothetical protein